MQKRKPWWLDITWIEQGLIISVNPFQRSNGYKHLHTLLESSAFQILIPKNTLQSPPSLLPLDTIKTLKIHRSDLPCSLSMIWGWWCETLTTKKHIWPNLIYFLDMNTKHPCSGKSFQISICVIKPLLLYFVFVLFVSLYYSFDKTQN